MVILWHTQYYNKIEIWKYTNNAYHDVYYYIYFMYNPYLLKDNILVSHKIVTS